MAVGDFVLKPVSVNHNDGFGVGGFSAPATNPELLENATVIPGGAFVGSYVNAASVTVNANLNFSCLGLGLYLDGSSTPTDTNNLPAGFKVITCFVKAKMASFTATPGEDIHLIRNGSIIATQIDNVGESDFSADLGEITNLSLVTSIIGFRITNAGAGNHLVGSELRIEGTYISESFTFTITPPGGDIDPRRKIRVTGENVIGNVYASVHGDKVSPIDPKIINENEIIIEAPDHPTEPCLECINDCPDCIQCFAPCNNDLASQACQQCLEICFDCLVECFEDYELAEECQKSTQKEGPTDIEIIMADPGSSFEGSVPIGSFVILIARASGIYQFVPGKTNDTLYATARNGSTYDVRIPHPKAKTWFFRS